jgi:hypothetical protein
LFLEFTLSSKESASFLELPRVLPLRYIKEKFEDSIFHREASSLAIIKPNGLKMDVP